MKIKIEDWYNLHQGFDLDIAPGYTAFVGPNGAGKTTLLRQIKELAEGNDCRVMYYSNLTNGSNNARQAYLFRGKSSLLVASAISSEGEQIAMNFGQHVRKIGKAIHQCQNDGTPLVILLDALDSGASIDRIREIRHLFDLIANDTTGKEVYIISAVNSYEMAKNADCVDIRTGEHLCFSSYEEFAEYICGYKLDSK